MPSVDTESPWWGVTSAMCPRIRQPLVARPGGVDLRSSVVLAETGSPTLAFLASIVLSICARIIVPELNSMGGCDPGDAPFGASLAAWARATALKQTIATTERTI